MIQIDTHSASFDVLRDVAAHLNQSLEEELRLANQRIGAKLNAEAKRIMVREIYAVPIPLMASANRTFDLEKVPASLRRYILAAGQSGPAVTHVRFKKQLTDLQKEKYFKSSRQSLNGMIFRKWRRSGDLLNNERVVFPNPEGGIHSVMLVNSMSYAAARYALGGPNPPNEAGRKAGVQQTQKNVEANEKSNTRSVQWQEQAVKESRDWIRQQYELAISRALRGVR